jgi:hypothetical protein
VAGSNNVTAAVAAEAALRLAGDVAGSNNVAAEAVLRAAGDSGLTQHVSAVVGASGTVWRAEWEEIRDELYDWELGNLVGVGVPIFENYSTIYGDILIMGRSWLQPQGGPGHWVYEWTTTNGALFVSAGIPTNVLRGSATKNGVEVDSGDGPISLAMSDDVDDAIDAHNTDDPNVHADIRALTATAVTNGGATVNGSSISNGAAINLTAAQVGAVPAAWTNGLPGHGCTLIASTNVIVTGATIFYLATNTAPAWTLSVSATASQHCYSVRTVVTNLPTLIGNMVWENTNEWSCTSTAARYVVIPETGDVYRVRGGNAW